MKEAEKVAQVKHPIDMDCKPNKKCTYCYNCGTHVRGQKYCHGCGYRLDWENSSVEHPKPEKQESVSDVAKTCLQLLANATGAEFDDEKLAVDIIAETIINTQSKKKGEKL